MKVAHRLVVVARCPVDDKFDVYETEITTERLLPVELILTAVEDATSEPIFQEDLTAALAETLGVTVLTSGLHSGVQTRCTATANAQEVAR